MRHIVKRPDHSLKNFLKRTIGAQIHFASALLAIVGMLHLLKHTELRTTNVHFWACLVYGITAVMVFTASACMHFLEDGFSISPKLERILTNLDHFAIYLFIAGSYTPVLINTIKGPWKYPLLLAIWGIALAGIFYTLIKPRLPHWAQHRVVFTSFYVLMGWAFLFKVNEILGALTSAQTGYLISGGLSYSIGAVVFATKRPHLFKEIFGFHELWHVLVTIGFISHYFAILSLYAK